MAGLVGNPGYRLLIIPDVKRVFGMPCLGQAQRRQRLADPAQFGLDNCAAIQERAMGAPGADDPVLIRLDPICGAVDDGRIVVGADRIRGGAHVAGVRRPIGKDIGHSKGSEPQRPRPPFAAFDGGVILDLGRGGRVEHNEKSSRTLAVPSSGQQIPKRHAIGIYGNRGRIALEMGASDHGVAYAKFVPRAKAGQSAGTKTLLG